MFKFLKRFQHILIISQTDLLATAPIIFGKIARISAQQTRQQSPAHIFLLNAGPISCAYILSGLRDSSNLPSG